MTAKSLDRREWLIRSSTLAAVLGAMWPAKPARAHDDDDRERKGHHMKAIGKITLLALGLAVVAGLAGVGFKPLSELGALVEAASEHILTFDVACDCRTGAAGPNRGDVFIISGKIFPPGTLPSGDADNDPTLPVNGVAPIGDWTCRGQNSFPFPPNIASAYSASPFAFFDWYFILNDGRGLTAAGYPVAAEASRLPVTGGIGGFSGASGEIQAMAFGTNATGCPNFRVKMRIQPGSMRGQSN